MLVLAAFQATALMRFTRAAVLEQLNQNYVRTAHAKGLKPWLVVNRHILRNALIPVVTLVALDIPAVFTGALVTEQVFRVPGIGSLLIDAIQRSDRSEEHTSELQSLTNLVCRLLLEKKKRQTKTRQKYFSLSPTT